jgi:plastocyanin
MTRPMRKQRTLALLALTLAVAVAPAALAKDHKVSIGPKYAPREIKIKAGDTVVWVNDDEKDHTVTADDDSFDSGNLGDGKSFRHTFKKAGKYKYHCEYHPRDKGVVVVE